MLSLPGVNKPHTRSHDVMTLVNSYIILLESGRPEIVPSGVAAFIYNKTLAIPLTVGESTQMSDSNSDSWESSFQSISSVEAEPVDTPIVTPKLVRKPLAMLHNTPSVLEAKNRTKKAAFNDKKTSFDSEYFILTPNPKSSQFRVQRVKTFSKRHGKQFKDQKMSGALFDDFLHQLE